MQAKIDLQAYVAASPAIRDNRAYVGTFENQVLCVDMKKAKILWQYENPRRNFAFYSSAAVNERLVIIGGRDKLLHALNRETGQKVWTFATKSRVDSSPVIATDRVVFASKSGVIYVLSLDSGKELWQFDTASSIAASPSLAQGKLVIGTEDGLLYCFGENSQ